METTVKQEAQKLFPPTNSPQQFTEIELTEEEKAEGLRKARQEKHNRVKQEEYYAAVNQKSPVPEIKNWIGFMQYVGELATYRLNQAGTKTGTLVELKKFLMSDGRKEIYIEICKYFMEDITCKYDLTKGILLQGNVGCGKSFFLKLCSNNPRKSFHTYDCVKLAPEYNYLREDKTVTGDRLITPFRNALGPKAFDVWKHQYCGAMFDDLGWEEVVQSYGNTVNVMERIINAIYSASLPFYHYHATTNLTEAELEEKYGSRIISRMREMFNFVILPGTDLRGR